MSVTSPVGFFTSDNGWFNANHRLTGNLPAYEESIGVPFISSTGGGVSSDALIMSNDWAPTVCQLAGITPPSTIDGTSFAPLLTNPAQPWRNRYLAERWKALGGPDAIFDMPNYLAIRSSVNSTAQPNQLYVQYSTNELEFYQLSAYPYELNNLAVTNPASVKSRLTLGHSYVQGLEACAGETCHNVEFQ